MSDIDELYRMVGVLLSRQVETDRKVAGLSFRGKVAEVDGEEQAIRLVIGQDPEGEDVLSPWAKVAQTAGAMSVHDMPSVGQQGEITAANGDIEQGSFRPLHWSEDHPSISVDAAAKKLTLGAVTIDLTDDGLLLTVGATSVSITDAGVAIAGTDLTHNSTNVGDTHKHDEVVKGLQNTGKPI